MLVRIKRFVRAVFHGSDVTITVEGDDGEVDLIASHEEAYRLMMGVDRALPIGPSHDEVVGE